MNKQYFSAVLVGVMLVASAGASHAATSKKEATGLGLGGLVGAAAGGPVGFFVGAAAGAVIGDRWHKTDQTAEQLSVSLSEANTTVSGLKRDIDNLNSDVERLGAELIGATEGPAKNALELLRAGVEMDVLFRTDDHRVTTGTSDRISEIATYLAELPGLSITVDGYSDPRGEPAYNTELSLKRAITVKEIMVDAGVSPLQIEVAGHGADTDPELLNDIDGLALERRVNVRFVVKGTDEGSDRLAGL